MAHDAERIGGRVPVVFVRVVPVGRRVICTGEGTDETMVADALAKPSVAAATLLRLWAAAAEAASLLFCCPSLLSAPKAGAAALCTPKCLLPRLLPNLVESGGERRAHHRCRCLTPWRCRGRRRRSRPRPTRRRRGRRPPTRRWRRGRRRPSRPSARHHRF